jgi:sugar O-acyltransferase (sialic acid O-acetyltransferase NeuD family)
MAKIIIFGQQDYAQQAHYYFTHDSSHEVVAFSVTADYREADSVFGLPLVDFETVQDRYPPGEFSFFVPMSGRSINQLRERFFNEAKAKGYPLVSYVSSKAVLCDNEIGENCFILELGNIQPFTTIGDNVTIWCNTHVGHHSHVGDHVWMGSGVIISGHCEIGHHSYLASQALIDSYVKVAPGTLAGHATLITKDTKEWSIYTGNPARKRKVDSRKFEFL